MSHTQADTIELSTMLEGGGACTAPLDAAVEYLRRRIASILPAYVLAMIPHAVVIALLIDAITAEQRSRLPRYCIYLCAATLWRWAGITWIQQRTQRDLQLRPGRSPGRGIFPILGLRLLSNIAISWGSFGLGVPSFYGLFLGGFASPLVLDDAAPAKSRIKNCLMWIHQSAGRLGKILIAATIMGIWLVIVIAVTQYFLIEFVFSHFLDIQLTEVQVTLLGWAWWLGIFYFAFLVLDMFWTVASVMLYYDSQSRRMATDLYARVAALPEEQP